MGLLARRHVACAGGRRHHEDVLRQSTTGQPLPPRRPPTTDPRATALARPPKRRRQVHAGIGRTTCLDRRRKARAAAYASSPAWGARELRPLSWRWRRRPQVLERTGRDGGGPRPARGTDCRASIGLRPRLGERPACAGRAARQGCAQAGLATSITRTVIRRASSGERVAHKRSWSSAALFGRRPDSGIWQGSGRLPSQNTR